MRSSWRNIVIVLLFLIVFIPVIFLLQRGVLNYYRHGGFFKTYEDYVKESRERYWQAKILRYKDYPVPENITGDFFRELRYGNRGQYLEKIYVSNEPGYLYYSERYDLQADGSYVLNSISYREYDKDITIKDHDGDGAMSVISVSGLELPGGRCRTCEHIAGERELSLDTESSPGIFVNGILKYVRINEISSKDWVVIIPLIFVEEQSIEETVVKNNSIIFNERMKPAGIALTDLDAVKIIAGGEGFHQVIRKFYIKDEELLSPEIELKRVLDENKGEVNLNELERLIEDFDFEPWMKGGRVKSYSYFPAADYYSPGTDPRLALFFDGQRLAFIILNRSEVFEEYGPEAFNKRWGLDIVKFVAPDEELRKIIDNFWNIYENAE